MSLKSISMPNQTGRISMKNNQNDLNENVKTRNVQCHLLLSMMYYLISFYHYSLYICGISFSLSYKLGYVPKTLWWLICRL